MTRLWLTGCGVVTALGAGVEETWSRLVRGDRAIGPIDLFDTSEYRSCVGAQVRAELPGDDACAGPSSRTTAMAFVAALEALRGAKLGRAPEGRRRGLVVAGTVGGMFETEHMLARFHADPSSREVLSRMLSHPLTSASDRLEAALGPFVRTRTLSSACSGGANALVVAAMWLLAGDVDVVLAGASDALCRLTLSGFNALAAIDPEPCRPFDARRRGLSLGEGAGFVVLEREETARARGAEPIAELAGWAIGSEAHHITNPEPSGTTPARLLRTAMERAGVAPEQIGYVNAHGTGTPLNDAMEARAIRAAFGAAAEDTPVSSSKGQIGHTLGASGAIEAVIASLAVSRGLIPPTGGLEVPDEACVLRHVIGAGEKRRVRAAVSSSFGFGGMDTVLVVSEPGFSRPHSTRAARSVVITGGAAITSRGVHDARETAALLGPPVTPPGPHVELDLGARLELSRARRLDRAARLSAVVVGRALEDAGARDAHERGGIILGTAFGGVDGSSAYMHRLFDKGPRLASPADFPNLVPSSPVGHASIYLGMRGPVLAVADLAASGEAALALAHEMVASQEADLVVGGAVEETSDTVERVFVALYSQTREHAGRAPRSEGAGAVVFEAEEVARARGASIMARVERLVTWRATPLVASLRAPRDLARARVVAPMADGRLEAVLAGTAWEGCDRVGAAQAAGDHEALGAIVAAAAAGLIARGEAEEVLAVGAENARGYAALLVRA